MKASALIVVTGFLMHDALPRADVPFHSYDKYMHTQFSKRRLQMFL